MMIKKLEGLEILDSRGRPTIKAICTFENDVRGAASIPSGASTGKAEAKELRDGDLTRYGGLGCTKAVHHINTIINNRMAGKAYASQHEFDQELLKLDPTPDKRKLGANAILACSIAFARTAAKQKQIPLYQYFGNIIGNESFLLPRPTVNLFSGGLHAGGQIPVQDLLVIPISADTMDKALQQVYSVYQSAIKIIKAQFNMRPLTADEGGLAPDFQSVEKMLDCAIEAIKLSGFEPGKDIALAMDVAASHFFQNGKYLIGNQILSSQDMIDLINSWVTNYPLISIEDGLAEDDWHAWPHLKSFLADKSLVMGDDLLCTQVTRIQKAQDTGAANALLLKVNQCGTLSEGAAALNLAKSAGWQVTVSARSGETEDDWLADLAIGWNGNQIKIGSLTQSERLAKYNRMLELEYRHKLIMREWGK